MEVSEEPSDNALNLDAWVAKLLTAFTSKTLTEEEFHKHWALWVNRAFYKVNHPKNLLLEHDDQEIQRILLNPLEKFLCNGESIDILQEFSELNKPPSICGHVFKMGQPTYSCKECGADGTCVLCVDCFNNSVHKHHKYKISTSNSGGCCDCGDEEAWKSNPYCDTHIIGTQIEPEDDSKLIPEDFLDRMEIVFKSILSYAFLMLSTDHIVLPHKLRVPKCDNLPKFLDLPQPLDFTQPLDLPESWDLPKSLDLPLLDLSCFDRFCTVLYNDEQHTFDQVISTIMKVLKCDKKTASEYVTNIDREGRSVVKCGTFPACCDLSKEIEKCMSQHGTKPLKVLIIASDVIIHQTFAIRLLDWLNVFLNYGQIFRSVFVKVVLDEEAKYLDLILLNDSHMWKSARLHFHQLIISGMLKEYKYKTLFAEAFVKNYVNMVHDFFKDDQDHMFSAMSLSVQVFTVPTLAHYLIEKKDTLLVLVKTFFDVYAPRINKNGKFEFDRSSPSIKMKQSSCILSDIWYLLKFTPTKWNDMLRTNYINGFNKLLELFEAIQGMDQLVRQTGQHMEFEPEWEPGFNLHIRLSKVLQHFIQWCGSDKQVLIRTYNLLMKSIKKTIPDIWYQNKILVDVQNCFVESIDYDVSTQPVSIHLPLSRLFSGIYLHLSKYDLNYNSPELNVDGQLEPAFLLEPVLEVVVMMSQVGAGLWRRNGYSLTNQVYFYQIPKYRSELLNRDITFLQICATLMDSNHFLLHLLNRFSLRAWILEDFSSTFQNREVPSIFSAEDESIKYLIVVVEEFLKLLVILIGERYVYGIGEVGMNDSLKNELIQQLCVKPLSHSELLKATLEDFSDDSVDFNDILKDVANFKTPQNSVSSNKGGMYELKEEYYDDFNIFFYHYFKEDFSKSEVAQCKRRKDKGLLECCPAPKLPKLTASFEPLLNVLQSDVMFVIIRTVLNRCLDLKARDFSELQLQLVLHLIGYGLREEQSQRYDFFRFTERAEARDIFGLLQKFVNFARVENHKNLVTWTLNKYKEMSSNAMMEVDVQEPIRDDKKVADNRAELVAKSKAKIMAQFQAMQTQFVNDNLNLFEDSDLSVSGSKSCNESLDVIEDVDFPIALGPNRSPSLKEDPVFQCILCQEEQKLTFDSTTMVYASFVQQSTVLSKNRSKNCQPNDEISLPFCLPTVMRRVPHTSTCGHVMHFRCWKSHFDNIIYRENRRPYRLRHVSSFSIEKGEFLCPLCECLNNTVMPIVPDISGIEVIPSISIKSMSDWLVFLRERFSEILENFSDPEMRVNLSKFPKLNSNLRVNYNLLTVLHIFGSVVYDVGSEKSFNLKRVPDLRFFTMIWTTCAYTIHSVETVFRATNKPLMGEWSNRQKDCLENLIKMARICGSVYVADDRFNSSNQERNAEIVYCLLSILFPKSDTDFSILDWDSFGFLVSKLFFLNLLFNLSLHDVWLMKIVLIKTIVQILVTNDVPVTVDCENEQLAETTSMISIVRILKMMGKFNDDSQIDLERLKLLLRNYCRPLLRSACLFYKFLSNVPIPQPFTYVGGDTYEHMCKFLGLEVEFDSLIDSEELFDYIKIWLKHKKVKDYVTNSRLKQLVPYDPTKINHLIELPDDYSELINRVSSFMCPNSEREGSRNPTMCLVCGEILCSQSYCCQTPLGDIKDGVGACTYHSYQCGAGVGLFLRIRECELLILSNLIRGCNQVPPYLDEYGEPDNGLVRGYPLKLCRENYERFNILWLSHGLHEEVTRVIENASNFSPVQWHNL